MPDPLFSGWCRASTRRSAVTCVLMLSALFAFLHINRNSEKPGARTEHATERRSQNPSGNAATVKYQRPTSRGSVSKMFNGTADDDPELVEYIRNQKILPPSTAPYNLAEPHLRDNSQFHHMSLLDNMLHNMTDGFFVEVGAYDGEKFSNTLYFERFRNWTGLLIEASPLLFRKLQTKNRKAFSIHACLSLTTSADIVRFMSADFNGRITADGKRGGVSLQCVPLYSLMLALGQTQIDLFSLDIEGDELKVLKTIPWDKMQIRLLVVEVNHIMEGAEAVKRYMESVGYTFIRAQKIDLIFAKQDLLDQASQ